MGVDDHRRGLAAGGKDAHLRQEALVDALVAETEVIALPGAVPTETDKVLADPSGQEAAAAASTGPSPS